MLRNVIADLARSSLVCVRVIALQRFYMPQYRTCMKINPEQLNFLSQIVLNVSKITAPEDSVSTGSQSNDTSAEDTANICLR
jgi:hypothetical protein